MTSITKAAFAAIILCVVVVATGIGGSTSVEAKAHRAGRHTAHRHHVHHHPRIHRHRLRRHRVPRGEAGGPVGDFFNFAPSSSFGASAHTSFVRGRLVCAINVNRELRARGYRGTGSALAMSFRHYGVASSGQPGDVAIFSRRGGGHVAIVYGYDSKGQRLYLNPSTRRQAWQVGPYHRRPIAFRTPT